MSEPSEAGLDRLVTRLMTCEICETRYRTLDEVIACAMEHGEDRVTALDRYRESYPAPSEADLAAPGSSALDKCADAGCRHWRSMHVQAKRGWCAARDCSCEGFLEPKKLADVDERRVDHMIAALRKPGEGARFLCWAGLHFYSRFEKDRKIEIMGGEYESRACRFCGAESLTGWWKRCRD